MKATIDFDNHLGKVIRDRRNKFGLDQKTLADAVGISRVAIVNIEGGHQGAKYEVLYKLCCALNIKPNELFPEIVKVEYKTETVKVKRLVMRTVTKRKITL